jgi:hypothetical protein
MSLPKIRIPIGTGADPIDVGVKEAGQIIVIFALMLTVLIGLVGIAIDVTYAWRNGLQIQRAADAAAMAGVVYMPGDLTTATSRADAVATSNGYTSGSGLTVAVSPNPTDNRQLDVTITAPVQTFFVRLFGINQWTVSRSARAAYIMPVPMGSPLSYMGVGCLVQSGVTAPACNSAGTGDSGVTTAGTSGGTKLSSLGAWGAVITKGGNQENGDAYSPANNTPATTWTVDMNNNVSYDPNGYYYTAVLPAGGSVQIFDPGFCENKVNGSTYYGTGDHWIAQVNSTYNAVSTYYTLLDTHNVPLNKNGWTIVPGTFSGSTFENQKGTDGGANGSGACDAYHNKWWTLASGLAAGTYEVEVSTTKPTDSTENADVNAENMFAIMVTGGGSPTVYGYDKMAVYNNLSGNGVLQQFYLAKVDRETGAGKTLTIDLFDVGDSTAGFIQILSPDAGTLNPTSPTVVSNFSYTTYNYNTAGVRVNNGNCASGNSDTCSGSNRSMITVAKTVSGSTKSSFNNTWIEITIPLPSSYGSAGGTAPIVASGTPDPGLWQGGWWQVQYNVSGGNDTTTWSVNVNGNPVHLVPIN